MKQILIGYGMLMLAVAAGACNGDITTQLRAAQYESEQRFNRLMDDYEREQSQRIEREQLEVQRQRLQHEVIFDETDHRYGLE